MSFCIIWTQLSQVHALTVQCSSTRGADHAAAFDKFSCSWLLDVQACGQRKECIQVYKDLENSHPMPAVRRQAADIRYILEAPKLQLSPDEYVKIPILENADRYQ